jgi:phospholipid/cholesterol/gamma-HCH transport system substrate-binding protein
MDQTKRELQVGTTVLVSLLILVVGFLWFERVRLGADVEQYQADFSQVSGLQVGDRVQVRGIRMGTVTDFEIFDEFVRVTFQLEDGVSLREDSQIKLASKGIVGEMLIDIDPGTGNPVQTGHIFQGQAAATIESITGAAETTMQDVQELTAELRAFVVRLRDEGHIVETMSEAHGVVAGLGGLVDENRASVRALLEDASASARALRAVLADSSLVRTVQGSAGVLARTDSLLAQVGTTAARLDSVMANLATGDGTMGRLIRDESLYTNADSMLVSLHRLLDELRRNPRKYFQLSVLDF